MLFRSEEGLKASSVNTTQNLETDSNEWSDSVSDGGLATPEIYSRVYLLSSALIKGLSVPALLSAASFQGVEEVNDPREGFGDPEHSVTVAFQDTEQSRGVSHRLVGWLIGWLID